MRVFVQYSDNTLIPHLKKAPLYSFQYSQNTGFLPPLHLGKTDIGIWNLFLFKWLNVYSENLNGFFKTFKTSPLFHPLTVPYDHISGEVCRFTVKTYIVFQRIHVRTRALRPDISLHQPCARRRQGGGVAAPLSDGRGTVYTPRAETTSGSHTDLPFCHTRAARHQMRTRDRLVGPFVCHWMLRTVRRLRNMTIPRLL